MSENTILRLLGDALVLDSEGHLVGIQQLPAGKQSIKVADATIALSDSLDVILTAAILKNIKRAVITTQASFHASATAGMAADLYASGDGVVYDTETYIADLEPAFAAGVVKQKSYPINLGIYAGKITIQNLDTVQALPMKAYITY